MKPITESVVLIVDDEVGVTRLCQRLLTRVGYQVAAFNRPQDGINLLNQERIDLLLVDIRMPEMDGFQLMEIARHAQPDLAVVIMTGYGTVDTAVETLRRGADGIVLKPFSGAELVQSVERALREKWREREMQRLRALRPLFAITESLFSEKNPDRLINIFLDMACEHLDCAYAGFYIQATDSDKIQSVAEQGASLSTDGDVLISRVAALDKPLKSSLGVPDDPEMHAVLSRHGIDSVICVPNSFGRQHSFMMVGRIAGEAHFSNADLDLLTIFSRQAVIALENAQLYSELHAHVHQLKESQQALIQAEKMAAVGRLTASIAHEINNPLQSVRNCLHLIEHGNFSQKELHNYISLAAEELDRLMKVTRRMLDYYRPGKLDRSPTNVNELVERVLQLLEAQLKSLDIQVHKRLTPDLPAVVVVGNQIQQVIVNIVLNAMGAMPDGGVLFTETNIRDNQVIISVEDTGAGVPKTERESIFEPFTSSKEGGLGLGLTVSYGIVTAHGGILELLPQDERGAKFQISLPIRP